jgi:glycosyltransferase involved in cell wall biosynthesis
MSGQVSCERPVIVFADLVRACGAGVEDPGRGPDQGERIFVRELARRLCARVPTVVLSSSREDDAGILQVPGGRLVSRELAWHVWRSRPRAIVYVYPVTAAALLRARLLKLQGRGARLIVIALASHPLEGAARVACRLLWPDLVMVTSAEERARLSALGAPVEQITTGVDLRRFRPAGPDEQRALRRKWGLPEEGSIVLHVGHLVAARNLKALLPLAAVPGVTPVVLVSGVREAGSERLREDLRRGGVVVLDGYQPNVDELYRAADCYVFPSSAWGGGIEMPLSVLEAMASDLPVVSTPFGALPERFANADGVRFATNDRELARCVQDLLERRPHTRRLVEAYSWDAVVDRLLPLLGGGP